MGTIKSSASHLMVLLLTIACVKTVQAQATLEIITVDQSTTVVVEFDDVTINQQLMQGIVQPEDVLAVYLFPADSGKIHGSTSIIGEYKIYDHKIHFKPLIPFSENLRYEAVFMDSLSLPFQIPLTKREKTTLLVVYPTSDTLPANLLKIYLQFSAPMREGEVYQRVQLYHQSGRKIEAPFVPLRPELWSTDGKTVTLWIDPGRVKRALGSYQERGPVLNLGASYSLEVSPGWNDATGRKLGEGYSKKIHIVAADRVKPKPKLWKLMLPLGLSRTPLTIDFGESMDAMVAQNGLSIWKTEKTEIAGCVSLGIAEKSWEFIPDQPWQPGNYGVRISSVLEDLAGNNLNRLFERDISQDSSEPPDQEFYWIEFHIADP